MMHDENVRIRVIVSGRVQGVHFRAHTAQHAEPLGICGWVRNRADGTVEVLAEGTKANLRQLVQYLNTGPSLAVVTNVNVTWHDATNEFNSFRVRYF